MWLKGFVLTIILFFSLLTFSESISFIETSIIEEIEVQEEVVEEDGLVDMPNEPKEEDIIEVEIVKFEVEGIQLREGIASEEVLRLKRFLSEKGYAGIMEDYYYDNKTREIVIKYQEENGLIPDGIIGKNTYQKINEDIELNNINISEIKIEFTKEIPEKDWIVINKSNNTLYHLQGKEIIKKYPVGTGKNIEFTPEGKFTIVAKYQNPTWGGAGRSKPIKGGASNNPLGKRWMGLSIQGGGVYGIHGNSNKDSIGKYVSLGCIRMFNEDVETLYDLIGKGAHVWIGNNAKLNEYGILFN